MNDMDEDAEAIKRVNDKMGIATRLSTPHTSLLAPASLYLTAILEYVHPCGIFGFSSYRLLPLSDIFASEFPTNKSFHHDTSERYPTRPC